MRPPRLICQEPFTILAVDKVFLLTSADPQKALANDDGEASEVSHVFGPVVLTCSGLNLRMFFCDWNAMV